MAYYLSPAYMREHIDVAILCAKPCESNAVEAMFEEELSSSDHGKLPGDQNVYSLGTIGRHRVALGYLPDMGIGNAASAASSFKSSFPNIRLGLVVGICGGVPIIDGRDGPSTGVLLGDVMISTRVMNPRFGTQQPDDFIPKDILGTPSKEILGFLHRIKGIKFHEELEKETSRHTSDLQKDERYRNFVYPGAHRDKLYSPNHRHKHHQQKDRCETCNNCNNLEDRVCNKASDISCETLGCSEEVLRARLVEARESSANLLIPTAAVRVQTRDPKLHVHFGVVASTDTVMKSGQHRDKIVTRHRAEGEHIIAFEMEGAGVWDTLPTLVIKGVSDYADSHKRDEWQNFAAARAAACMKVIVKEWSKVDTPLWKLIPDPHRKLSIPAEALPKHLTYTRCEYKAHMRQDRTPESSRSNVGDKIDRAEALINKRDQKTMRNDLDEARKILTQVLDLPETLSSDSLRRVYWGLMVAEKELSCDRSFNHEDNNEAKTLHIEKAEEWNSKLLSQNLDTSLRIRVHLERYIIQGRKASLALKREPESLEASRSRDDAIKGIDRKLKELKEKDLNKYKEVQKYARQWQESILRP